MALSAAEKKAQDGAGQPPPIEWVRQRTPESGEERDFYPNDSPRVRGGLFADDDALKEQMRKALLKPEYTVTKYYKTTGWPQMIARHPVFENVTLAVIAFNALWIAIDTDYNDALTLLDAEPIFQIAEHFFAVYFTAEWLIRFLSFEKKRNGLRDAWFVFDSVLVFMMVMETWVMTIVILIAGGSSGGFGNASILRLLRLLRLSRLLRMLRSMPELMIMIKGMASAASSVIFTLLLLGITLYVFAIAFVQMSSDSSVGDRYFSGVPKAMYTLIVYGTFVDSVSVAAGDLWGITDDGNTALGIMFFLFVVLSALMVMNMLIGVLCEVVSAVSAVETERMNVCYVKGKMESILGGATTISKTEFTRLLDNRDAMNIFKEVGVDPVVMVTMIDSIFGDADKVQFFDFMEAVMQLRGDNQATVKDFIELTKFFRQSCRAIEDSIAPRTSSRNSRPGSRGPSRPMSRSHTGINEPALKEPRNSGHSVSNEPNCRNRSKAAADSVEEENKSHLHPQRPSLRLQGVPRAPSSAEIMSPTSAAMARIQPMKLDMLLRASLLEATRLQSPPPNDHKDEVYTGLQKWAASTEAALSSLLMDLVRLQRSELARASSRDPLSPGFSPGRWSTLS